MQTATVRTNRHHRNRRNMGEPLSEKAIHLLDSIKDKIDKGEAQLVGTAFKWGQRYGGDEVNELIRDMEAELRKNYNVCI